MTVTFKEHEMKKIILAVACLVLIVTSPLVASELEQKPVNRTDQAQTVDSRVKPKGMTQAPNRVSKNDKVSSTGHKHDGQGSEDLRPNPLDKDAANSVNTGRLNSVNQSVQK